MNGHAVQIVRAKDVGFELDVQALKDILLNDNVKDKKVVVLSVAGAYRKGKSFLLCFFLRYLKANCCPQWLGGPDEPLTGFSWKGGYEKHTSGILMWSEVFIIKMQKNEEVAVILLDSEGAFDCKSSVQECALIFALSTMVSSVQVYNLSGVIHETDLQHLQLFTEYGRLACEKDSCNKPFQKLQFLVRDWFHSKDFGIGGGNKYLQEMLAIPEPKQKPELKRVHQYIQTCFNDLSCFLMPFPGKKVAGDSDYDGRSSGMENEFKEQLQILIPLILSPKNLVIKEIDGKQITAGKLFNYFQAYMQIFEGDEIPTPLSWYEATAQANNQIAANEAMSQYKESMNETCLSDSLDMTSTQFYEEHLRLKESAIAMFTKMRKMGEAAFSDKYELILSKEIDVLFSVFQKLHEMKLGIKQKLVDVEDKNEELANKLVESEKEKMALVMKQYEEMKEILEQKFRSNDTKELKEWLQTVIISERNKHQLTDPMLALVANIIPALPAIIAKLLEL